MRSDSDIERDVREELLWDPSASGADVTVTADRGVVTLAGDVPSYAVKVGVERDAQRVSGVRAVVQHLNVRLPDTHERADAELGQAVANALRWDIQVPDSVKARVENGWVTLEGSVDWGYQRSAAERAVRNLMGIRGVADLVTVKPAAAVADVKRRIEAALKRSAEADAQHITVEASDGTITLRGTVHSWLGRSEATRAAWAAPGVREVKDLLSVNL